MSQYRENEYQQREDQHSDQTAHESPDAIKADIEQTRAEMGAKIDQLKARMDPEQLKAQAQETVNEVLTDTANSISDYVRTNRRQLTDSVVDTVKQNPLPAALIGVGLGWLFVEAFTSDERSYNDNRYRRQQFRDGVYQQPGAYGRYSTGYERNYNEAGYYPTQRGYDEGSYDEANSAYYRENSWRDDNGDGNWANEKLNEAQSQASELADQAQNTAERMGNQIQHSAEQTGRQIQHTAEQTGEQIQQTARQAGEQVREGAATVGRQAQEMGGQVSQQAQQLGHQAAQTGRQVGQQAQQLGYQAQRQAMIAGDQMQRSLQENPMTFGALAFAAGAALALMLPQTRPENRMMGETREQLVESGQAVARDVAQRAQHVAEEVQPELEKTVQKVTDDLRETGRQAYEDVQQTMEKAKEEAKQTAQKAQDKAESESEQAKQKAKAEAEKVGEQAKQDMEKANEQTKAKTATTSQDKSTAASKKGSTTSSAC